MNTREQYRTLDYPRARRTLYGKRRYLRSHLHRSQRGAVLPCGERFSRVAAGLKFSEPLTPVRKWENSAAR
jgi:hypothetical protein